MNAAKVLHLSAARFPLSENANPFELGDFLYRITQSYYAESSRLIREINASFGNSKYDIVAIDALKARHNQLTMEVNDVSAFYGRVAKQVFEMLDEEDKAQLSDDIRATLDSD